MSLIELPWPPSTLSGHNKGHWHAKSGIVAKHRHWAKTATLAIRNHVSVSLLDDTDILISVTFYPPDRRGDRVNFPNRIKPYWDGIADALGVNDRRFLPNYHFALPCGNPRVVFCFRDPVEMAVAA
jgi:crossover junction endodeoxyribonuclease RusA